MRGLKWRRGSESNRRIKVLQTSPLPLGYRALQLPKFSLTGGNSPSNEKRAPEARLGPEFRSTCRNQFEPAGRTPVTANQSIENCRGHAMNLLSGVILGCFLCNLYRFLWRSWPFGEGLSIDMFSTGPYKTVIVTWPVEHKRRR